MVSTSSRRCARLNKSFTKLRYASGMRPDNGRRRRIVKGVCFAVAALMLLAGLAYGGVCLWVTVHARSFVFAAVPRISTAPQAVGLNDVAEGTIRTDDGERRYGWWEAALPGACGILVLLRQGGVGF